MRNRFHRPGQAGVSFFAFQDIITAVTGILLIITVFLSLNIKEGTASLDAAGDPATPELKVHLEQLLQTITERRRAAESQSTAGETAPRALEIEIALLEKEAAELLSFLEKPLPDPAGKPMSALVEATARDIAAARLDAALLGRKIAQLKREESTLSAERIAAEAEVKAAEAALLSQQEQKNRLVLVHEASRTSKEPVIVVVGAAVAKVLRFDSAASSEFSGNAGLREALAKISPLEQYLVFYNKPSGAAAIDEYLKTARGEGFEVGYDAVPENFELHLEPKKGAAP